MILEAYAACTIYLACAKAWMRSDINHEWVIYASSGGRTSRPHRVVFSSFSIPFEQEIEEY